MKQQFYKLPQILISLCLLLILSTPIQAEPPNLSLIRKEIKNYYDSG
ncbi:TPA: acid phosphatase, partial [Legionella pneumophila]|nr:acid phosphatase [Legionella pneumophila]